MLTHGDRRASEVRDLSEFNIDSKYGKEALKDILFKIVHNLPTTDYDANFIKLAKKALSDVALYDRQKVGAVPVPTFLNR